jgi:hypothetical protein
MCGDARTVADAARPIATPAASCRAAPGGSRFDRVSAPCSGGEFELATIGCAVAVDDLYLKVFDEAGAA